MRRVFALGFVYFAYVAACASGPAAAPAIAPEPEPAEPAPKAAQPLASAEPAKAAEPAPPAESAEPEGDAAGATKPASGAAKRGSADLDDSACPAGMQLIEGDYCTKVENKCLEQWHDVPNDKDVCEDFEPHTECVGEKVHKRYCIDTYAWPNQKGARPEVMNKFHQAQVKCAAVGKRMCTESEWTFACEGPDMLPFPYGYKRDPNKCRGDVAWDSPNMSKVRKRDPEELARLWKGARSGTQPECISPFGVADMPGNNDEITQSESYDLPGFRGRYDSINTGGPWYKGVRNQCRPKIYTHEEGFYYYFLGFRCCAEADGKPTEPLTGKQRKEKWSMKRVERMAGFTVDEMKDVLKKKAEGKCTCGEKDIRCKTMCGTLLGPGAKDWVPPANGAAKDTK